MCRRTHRCQPWNKICIIIISSLRRLLIAIKGKTHSVLRGGGTEIYRFPWHLLAHLTEDFSRAVSYVSPSHSTSAVHGARRDLAGHLHSFYRWWGGECARVAPVILLPPMLPIYKPALRYLKAHLLFETTAASHNPTAMYSIHFNSEIKQC